MFKTRWTLSQPWPLPPPLPSSLPSLSSWCVPECNAQVHPPSLSHWCVPGRLFVAGNTCPSPSSFSSLSLSLSLSFLHLPSSLGVPGCFRRSWEPFLFGVSLDACVVAGSTFLPFFSFSFLPPFPPLPFSRAACLQTNKASAIGFSMRFGFVIGLSPFFWFPFHWPPQASSFLFVHVFLSSCLFILILPSLARTFVRTLACTHTRTRILLTTRFRWPRFVTMRFGSSVAPLHLILLHRQSHTLFVCLVLFLFICLVCVHMCLA